MTNWHIFLAFFVGLALGLSYFGGLWWTVKRLPKVRYPELAATGSFFLRIALLMAGFYIVMDGHWLPLVVCVLGFFTMRHILVRRLAGVV